MDALIESARTEPGARCTEDQLRARAALVGQMGLRPAASALGVNSGTLSRQVARAPGLVAATKSCADCPGCPAKAETPRPIRATPNPWHRNPNTVRTRPRKAFGSGPVIKGYPFGRCRPVGRGEAEGSRGRYT